MSEKKTENDENIKVKAQSVTLVAMILYTLPLIFQSVIDAIVVFFTTIGLEAWWKKEEVEEKAKKKKKKPKPTESV